MRSLAALAAISGLVVNIAIAQEGQRLPLQPTRLEALATQPAARVLWAKEMGQINSSEARVVVTALIVEDEAEPPGRLRGIRIFLSKQDVTDQVYIEEAKLEAVRKALAEIARRVEEFHNEQSDTPLRYSGSAVFRQLNENEMFHTLNAAYYIVPGSSGLSLSAFKDQEFRFPYHNPSELAALIGRAMEELKQQGGN